jgi:hypothetical protein
MITVFRGLTKEEACDFRKEVLHAPGVVLIITRDRADGLHEVIVQENSEYSK